MKRPVIVILLLSGLVQVQLSQDGAADRVLIISDNAYMRNAALNAVRVNRLSALKIETKDEAEQLRSILLTHPFNIDQQQESKVKRTFNIVSSFRENIRFGGFWGKYAIININPSLNIKPFDFISIYANQNLSCFIPIDGIKEHFKSLFVQGVAILAVDNSVKLFFDSHKILPVLAGFVIKNFIISTVIKSINKQTGNKMYAYNSYYYSMSIRF
jgi:hypothetical protein